MSLKDQNAANNVTICYVYNGWTIMFDNYAVHLSDDGEPANKENLIKMIKILRPEVTVTEGRL